MGVDPATHKQLVGIAIVEEVVVTLLRRVAGVGGGLLVGNDEMIDEERVGNYSPTENTTGLQVAKGVGVCEVEEGRSEIGR